MNQNQKSKETASAIPHSALRTPHSAVPDLKKRTQAFALRILKLVDALPKTTAGRALASQIVRSGTSVAANYRAAWRAKSTADFIAKMGIVEEEADETLFWLELLDESELVTAAKLAAIKQEANELVGITVASIKTARRNRTAESALKARPRPATAGLRYGRIPHSELL
jgi:four helix bundle protein